MSAETDLKRAILDLSTKAVAYRRLWNYYEGKHPLVFSSEKLAEVFDRAVPFVQNWCEVIINAALDRLIIDGWSIQDGLAKDALDELWRKTQLRRRAGDVHKAALVTGEAFVVVQKDADKAVRAFYNDPCNMAMYYDDEKPQVKKFAVKAWLDTQVKKWRLNLYYLNRIEHYINNGADFGSTFTPYSAENVKPVEPHDFGFIPIIHFRRDLRTTIGELTPSVLSIQDAINKLFSDMMVTSEYSAFQQRWVIGRFEGTGKIPVAPFTTVEIPPGAPGEQPVSVGQFEASDPQCYLLPLEQLVHSIAIISRTPKSYFLKTGGDPSGEALQAMEAPLVSKVESMQDNFGDSWGEVGDMMLAFAGVNISEDEDLWPLWKPAATPIPKAQAEIREINTRAGLPIEWQMKREGLTEEELQELHEAKADEATRGNIPRLAGLPGNVPEGIRAAAIGEAKGALAGGLQPEVVKAITGASQTAVDRMVRDGTLEKFMAKWAGKPIVAGVT